MRGQTLLRITLAVVAAHAPSLWLAASCMRWPASQGGRGRSTAALAARWVPAATREPRQALEAMHAGPPPVEPDRAPPHVGGPTRTALVAGDVGSADGGGATTPLVASDARSAEGADVPARTSRARGPEASAPALGIRPLYPTRLPPPATFVYRVHQSNPDGRTLDGPARLDWRRDLAGYTLRLLLQPAGRPERSWTSDGAFDRGGLAPRRLVQRDGARETRRLEFDMPGASSPAHDAAAAHQDRWSWLAQLAAILEARRDAPADVDLAVMGLRGTLEQWRFTARKPEALPSPVVDAGDTTSLDRQRAARLLLMVKEPERPYDLRVEAWLDPARHHWPAALRLSTPPSRWTFCIYGPDEAAEADPTESRPPEAGKERGGPSGP